jgi:hypothetical protein
VKRLTFICTLGLVALAAVGVAFAAQERQFTLRPLNGSKVSGTGTLRALGSETALSLKLRGLPGGKTFRTVLGSGTCVHRSGPFTGEGGGVSRPNGTALASSFVRIKGLPVAFKKIADGKHIVLIFLGTRAVACGVIPA